MTEKLGNVYVCAPARPVWFICPPKMYELNESRGEKQLSSPAKCDLYPLLKWRTNWCLFQSYIFLPRLFLKVSFLLHVFSFVIPLSVLYRGNDHKMCIGQKMWGNKRNVWTVRNQRSLFWPVSLMKEMEVWWISVLLSALSPVLCPCEVCLLCLTHERMLLHKRASQPRNNM